MVAYTSVFDANDNDVQYTFSLDAGATWSNPSSMPNWTFEREDNVDLAASMAPSGRFHAVYRHNLPSPEGGDIWYQWTDVGTPNGWSSALDVDEGSTASGHNYYPRPAVGTTLAQTLENEALVAWTSYGGVTYDVYFDSPALGGLIFADGFESGNSSAWSSWVP